MAVKQADVDALRTNAAQAIQIAKQLIVERDNVIALAKEALMTHMPMRMTEKEALAMIFSRLHGKKNAVREVRPPSPYGQMGDTKP